MDVRKETIMATEKKNLSLNEKLMRIQVELKAPKNLYNSFGKYHYRNAEGIQEALKPMEKAFGVVTTLSDSIEEVGGRIYVKATATLTDVETGDQIAVTAYAREASDKKGLDDSQITGSTSSYARKYALNGLFLLDDTKDTDTEEYQSAVKQSGNKTTSEPKTTPAPANEPDYRSMLRQIIIDHKLNPQEIATACGLSKNSTNEDFEKAYFYALNIKPNV